MKTDIKSLQNITPYTSLPELEKEMIKYWESNNIFEASLELRKGKKKFTFYDGPPFANGLPHYGHMLAMSIKDLFVRYKTMRGFYVPRRNGWDCHGLPVEYQLEKELGLSGKKQIEQYGIDKFNAKARASVYKYVDIWTDTIKRLGRWVDFSKSYSTLDNNYIESVWWVFKQLWDKGLVYKGYSSQPYCPRCDTSLSNFETNQGYKDNISDPSVFIKFRKKGTQNEYFLAWTTTPWTLPANTALAVSPDQLYGKYKVGDDEIWVASDKAKELGDTDIVHGRIGELVRGQELVGKEYEPLFPITDYQHNKIDGRENAYKIYAADFVNLDDGTGIVHVAPAYGQDDMSLGKKHKLPVIFSTDFGGKMVTEIALAKWIKDADPIIVNDLKERGLLYKSGTIKHTYPFCWRCDSPLIYIATSSWFVKASAIKDRLVENNNATKWQPSYIKDGRFGKWLEGAKDWNVARRRYWGAPLPIWICEDCGEVKVVGSIKELNVTGDIDLHRPQIDDVMFTCQKCQNKMKRVDEVFDCWFESGSMPYAQWHYPFENKEEFNEDFPADFIAEGLDQTRGWFYTLHVLSTALFDEPAYYNVVVNGLILAENGQKLSKRLRNYPEPDEIFNELGADALRQYLFSATQIGEDYRFSKRLVAEEQRKTILPLWNTLVFYKQFIKSSSGEAGSKDGLLDKWVVSELNSAIAETTQYMEDYDLTRASRRIRELVQNVSLWYLRLSRKRTDNDFSVTLKMLLGEIAKLIAPFMPFMAEAMYLSLKDDNANCTSVHLEDWPKGGEVDNNLLRQMSSAQKIVEMGHSLRARFGLKLRQPLQRIYYTINDNTERDPSTREYTPLRMTSTPEGFSEAISDIILQELNIKEIATASFTSDCAESGAYHVELDKELSDVLKEEGDTREIIRAIQSLRKQLKLMPQDTAQVGINITPPLNAEQLLSIGKQTKTDISGENIEESRASQTIKLWRGQAILTIK